MKKLATVRTALLRAALRDRLFNLRVLGQRRDTAGASHTYCFLPLAL